jgi:hypothetical protein
VAAAECGVASIHTVTNPHQRRRPRATATAHGRNQHNSATGSGAHRSSSTPQACSTGASCPHRTQPWSKKKEGRRRACRRARRCTSVTQRPPHKSKMQQVPGGARGGQQTRARPTYSRHVKWKWCPQIERADHHVGHRLLRSAVRFVAIRAVSARGCGCGCGCGFGTRRNWRVTRCWCVTDDLMFG